MGVTEAAEMLAVSERRVRQMISDGRLHGDRIGRTWVIDRRELLRVKGDRRPAGRPWSPASAWAVLALADGLRVDLSPGKRSRAKARLKLDRSQLVGKLASRSRERRFFAHPGVLAVLSGRVVLSGRSAAERYGVDLVGDDVLEGYVLVSDVDRLVGEFGLDEGAERANVLLRGVADDVWPFPGRSGVAGRTTVAVDLLESDDQRLIRAGVEMRAFG